MKRVAALLILLMSSAAHAADGKVETVQQLDLQRYAGRWYEQASFPLFFQRNCASDTTADYSLREDGRITVINSCKTKEGKTQKAEAVAKKVDGSVAKLKVRFAPAITSFLPFVWGDYWVIGLDPNYQWSLVGTPNRKYLWILSRDKQLSAESLEQAKAIAAAQGFDLSQLRTTPQNP